MDALLVGYEDQENLGLRSVMAYLLAHGYTAALVPFSPNREENVVAVIQELQPRLVGFSLIFQYALDEFHHLMSTLRTNGVSAHFTAGGHFPSLNPEATLNLMPELDSVVRFEGELTLAELLSELDDPGAWQHIGSLAYRSGTEIVLTPLRPLITDLDSLPYVYRDTARQSACGIRMASMLASRGCLFNCSFCSIRQFYGKPTGPLRRVRSPQAVVDEMVQLYHEHNVRFFSFQDDDFAARTNKQRAWLHEFMACLAASGLTQDTKWKISCRVDDLDPDTLEKMITHGLMAVYLGVESGSNEGLRTLNKHVTAAQNLAAIELIKHHDMALGIGFMLFDPSSTIATLQDNVRFLREIGEDGYFPINFCKMLPYTGTPVETQLRNEGRLTGTITHPDYDFSDPKVNWYAFLVQRIFTKRNFTSSGLVSRLHQLDFDLRLQRAFSSEAVSRQELKLRQAIRRTNLLALDTLETLLANVVDHDIEALIDERDLLVEMADYEWRGEAAIEIDLESMTRASVPV